LKQKGSKFHMINTAATACSLASRLRKTTGSDPIPEVLPSSYSVFRKVRSPERHGFTAPQLTNQGDNCAANLG
jgi:hypothetical protein